MVKLENILNFSNIMSLFCFLVSIIDNFVMISKNYTPLVLIVNVYLFIIFIFLCLYRINNDTIETNKYLIYSGTYIFSGVLMLGMSDVSIGIGIILLSLSLSNYLFYIFIEKNFNRDNVVSGLENKTENFPQETI